MYYFIIISFIAMFAWIGIYILYKLYEKKLAKQAEKAEEEKRLEWIRTKKEEERLRLEQEHNNRLYYLQTHKIKLTVFDARRQLKKLINLYELVIVENYWINEPFYSKFYELLLLFEKNDFMKIDPNTKVITMNFRDKDNKIKTSKAYQVYSSRDIIEYIILDSMENILQFKTNDAQNIVIAICVFILEQSVHYLSREVPQNIITEMLYDYEYAQDIRSIVELVKLKNSSLQFVIDASNQALKTTETLPYNDNEIVNSLWLPLKLPQKFLQEF